MVNSRRIVKVFLASPGDLTEERKAAKEVVNDFNDLWAEELGYHIELTGWEDTVGSFGRPQATINLEVDRCELFVGLMWKRWGTPPDITGAYSSGFEEEFMRTLSRREKNGSPQMSLFFKEVNSDASQDPGEELKKVLAFQARLIEEKKIYYEGFQNVRDFERKLLRSITSYIITLRGDELDQSLEQPQARSVIDDEQQSDEQQANKKVNPSPLSAEGVQFLREFLDKTESKDDSAITSIEVARFRLLSNIVKNHNNDESSLGVHDANLIFSYREPLNLGHSEKDQLVVSGLDNLHFETVPLWRWVAECDYLSSKMLPVFTRFGPSKRQANAFAVMRLLSMSLIDLGIDGREAYITAWFSEVSDSTVKVAALNYLSECGITSDLLIIKEELDKNNYQTATAAVMALIRIKLRDCREKAVLALFELQPTTLDQCLIQELFDNDSTLSTELILRGVGHQNADVRRIVVSLLLQRCALTPEIAQKLLSDNDAIIRCEALKFLIDNGDVFSDSRAKEIIIKHPSTQQQGLVVGKPDSAGQSCWEHFNFERLNLLTDNELERAGSIYNQDNRFILDIRHFKKRGDSLRFDLRNQFVEVFDRGLAYLSGLNVDDTTIEGTRSLGSFLRQGYVRQGLDIICQKSDPQDLQLVRKTLSNDIKYYSAGDIEYLRQFGEWEDVPLIISLLSRPEVNDSRSLLLPSDVARYKKAANVIYALGKDRLSELVAIVMPSQLFTHLIVEISDQIFRTLSNESILAMLNFENSEIRKFTAVKSVRSLPKKRIKKILNDYLVGDEYRYYNVYHWLDLGVCLSREKAVLVAKKILYKEWSC